MAPPATPPRMRATQDTTYELDAPIPRSALKQRGAGLRIGAESIAGFDAASRRMFDISVSAILLLLLLPAILITAILIKLDSPGPILYRAWRVGYRGRELRMLKFRTMNHGVTGPRLTSGEDHRVTRVGVWLRRLKLDEIPQMWNVLTGEMSLVGPRPQDPGFVEMMQEDYEIILKVRPGVTGLSQIAFAEESTILSPDDPLSHYVYQLLPQKLALDKMYVTEQNIWLNLRILSWTVAAVVLRRAVAVHRNTGKMNLRMR